MAVWRQKHFCVTKATPPRHRGIPLPWPFPGGMLSHQLPPPLPPLPQPLPQESPWSHSGKQQPKAAGQSWAGRADDCVEFSWCDYACTHLAALCLKYFYAAF